MSKRGYDKFVENAKNASQPTNELLDFRSGHRNGNEEFIAQTIWRVLRTFNLNEKLRILDIGSGGSLLTAQLHDLANRTSSTLIINDSKEVLDLGTFRNYPNKVLGRFPDVFDELQRNYGLFDAILAISVFHYTREDGIESSFLQKAGALIKTHGVLVLGDLPICEQKIANKKNISDKELNLTNCYSYQELINFRNTLGDDFSMYIIPQDRNMFMSPHRSDVVFFKH